MICVILLTYPILIAFCRKREQNEASLTLNKVNQQQTKVHHQSAVVKSPI